MLQFKQFINCLRSTQQEHIADLLEGKSGLECHIVKYKFCKKAVYFLSEKYVWYTAKKLLHDLVKLV